MTNQVEVDGADQLARTLHQAAQDLGDLTALHDQLGDILVAAASPLTPRRTGALVAATTAIAAPAETALVNTAGHAIPVHWGNRGRPARPFLRDAALRTHREQLAAAETHVQKILDNVKGA